jgi:hypothetical protein
VFILSGALLGGFSEGKLNKGTKDMGMRVNGSRKPRNQQNREEIKTEHG